MTDSYNKFKSTTIYGNLINDTSGTYIANALFKGNVGFNGNIKLGSSNSNIYKYDGTLLGQKGDTGPQGDVGPSGYITLGRTGLTGPTGSTGSTGYKGPTGDNGLFGDKGSTGYKGPTGDNGVTGNKGQTGNNGVTGDNGPTGNKGPNGDIGTFSGTIVDLTSTGNITATNLDISGTIHTPYAKLLTGSTITSSYSGSFVEVQQGTGSSITLFDPTTIGLYKNPNASINIYNGTGSNLTISSSSGSVSNGDFSSPALGQDITYGYTTSSTSQTITSWFNQNVFFSNGYGSLRDQLGTYNDLISILPPVSQYISLIQNTPSVVSNIYQSVTLPVGTITLSFYMYNGLIYTNTHTLSITYGTQTIATNVFPTSTWTKKTYTFNNATAQTQNLTFSSSGTTTSFSLIHITNIIITTPAATSSATSFTGTIGATASISLIPNQTVQLYSNGSKWITF